MNAKLTPKQIALIESIAKRVGPECSIKLVEAESMTGFSDTLRYEESRVCRGHGRPVLRQSSGMVLSVTRPEEADAAPLYSQHPVALAARAKFEAECEAARTLFSDSCAIFCFKVGDTVLYGNGEDGFDQMMLTAIETDEDGRPLFALEGRTKRGNPYACKSYSRLLRPATD